MPNLDENREARLNALKARFGKNLGVRSQIGGKGSMRRKKRMVRKKDTQDDKRLQGALKRLNVNNIPAIEEVNLFQKGDDTVIHFDQPRVQASIAANTYVVSGNCVTKKVMEMLPGILPQLGPDNLENLKDMANQIQKMREQSENAAGDDDDEVPELVENVNFEDVAAEDPVSDDEDDEVPDLVETGNFDNPVPIAMSPNPEDNAVTDSTPEECVSNLEESTLNPVESAPIVKGSATSPTVSMSEQKVSATNPEKIATIEKSPDDNATTEKHFAHTAIQEPISEAKATSEPNTGVNTSRVDNGDSDANLD